MENPSLPKGTRDFGPATMAKRQFIFTTIRNVFQKFGFLPLETPGMENLSTLTGKYGEEGDQLLFKILNSGDFLKDVDAEKLNARNSKQLSFQISDKGLRYDLTVPFARYVVMNRHEIALPFKRYQIQPVWRGDRPAKARYREFYQCDADVVGTNSLICEAEIILMIRDVFNGLGITDYTIRINHRGILTALAENAGAKGNENALFVAIDKMDKIGEEKVKEELKSKGFNDESISGVFRMLTVRGSNTNKLAYLLTKFETNEHGQNALRDLREVLNLLTLFQSDESHVELDIPLARGLSYYTGCIFEVKINNVGIGSVGGGGRYDNLTQAFGAKETLPGVGFSFGVDRIFDAMEELNLFPEKTGVSSKVLICHLDEEGMHHGLGLLSKLRLAGIAAEIYPDISKVKKQLDYGNKKMIPYAVVIGSDEISSGQLAFKNMQTGSQEKLTAEQLIEKVAATLFNP